MTGYQFGWSVLLERVERPQAPPWQRFAALHSLLERGRHRILGDAALPDIAINQHQVPKSNTDDEILMITILGAGGAVGNELVKLLAAKNQRFRLVGRNPKATPGATETVAADLDPATI